jgi:hypothetical protein
LRLFSRACAGVIGAMGLMVLMDWISLKRIRYLCAQTNCRWKRHTSATTFYAHPSMKFKIKYN